MDADDGLALIAEMHHQITEERLYERWMLGYQKEMSFSEFKTRLNVGIADDGNNDAGAILASVKEIIDGSF